MLTYSSQAYVLTLGMLQEGGHAALDEDGLVLQQRAHKAPCRQLTQQVNQQLCEALAVQQLLPVKLCYSARCLDVCWNSLRQDLEDKEETCQPWSLKCS